MRAISNAVMAALVVLALFWGNCYSCPQILSSLQSRSGHGCCHHDKPATQECRTQILSQFQKTDPVDSVPVLLPALTAAIDFLPQVAPDPEYTPAIEQFPPGDLYSLRI